MDQRTLIGRGDYIISTLAVEAAIKEDEVEDVDANRDSVCRCSIIISAS